MRWSVVVLLVLCLTLAPGAAACTLPDDLDRPPATGRFHLFDLQQEAVVSVHDVAVPGLGGDCGLDNRNGLAGDLFAWSDHDDRRLVVRAQGLGGGDVAAHAVPGTWIQELATDGAFVTYMAQIPESEDEHGNPEGPVRLVRMDAGNGEVVVRDGVDLAKPSLVRLGGPHAAWVDWQADVSQPTLHLYDVVADEWVIAGLPARLFGLEGRAGIIAVDGTWLAGFSGPLDGRTLWAMDLESMQVHDLGAGAFYHGDLDGGALYVTDYSDLVRIDLPGGARETIEVSFPYSVRTPLTVEDRVVVLGERTYGDAIAGDEEDDAQENGRLLPAPGAALVGLLFALALSRRTRGR